MYLSFSAPASIYNVGAWIQYPDLKDNLLTLNYNRDRDDFSFLKLFMNVSNVSKANTPMPIGTHLSKNLVPFFQASDFRNHQYINGSIHKFYSDKDLSELGLSIKPKL